MSKRGPGLSKEVWNGLSEVENSLSESRIV